jgi:hypothetical protein
MNPIIISYPKHIKDYMDSLEPGYKLLFTYSNLSIIIKNNQDGRKID